jgi:toxin CptA
VTTRVFNQTLSLAIAPSRQLWLLVIAAHLLAGLSLLLIDLNPPWRMVGWGITSLHALYVWRDSHWLRNLQQLQYAHGDFHLHFSGAKVPALADGNHLVTPWLVILSLKVSGKRRHLPLFPDACNADDLRRLRVLLRCGAGAVNHS